MAIDPSTKAFSCKKKKTVSENITFKSLNKMSCTGVAYIMYNSMCIICLSCRNKIYFIVTNFIQFWAWIISNFFNNMLSKLFTRISFHGNTLNEKYVKNNQICIKNKNFLDRLSKT